MHQRPRPEFRSGAVSYVSRREDVVYVHHVDDPVVARVDEGRHQQRLEDLALHAACFEEQEAPDEA